MHNIIAYLPYINLHALIMVGITYNINTTTAITDLCCDQNFIIDNTPIVPPTNNEFNMIIDKADALFYRLQYFYGRLCKLNNVELERIRNIST